MSTELEAHRVVDTIALLERRIGERFAGSGLARVCGDLLALSRRAGDGAERLRRPIWPLRIAAAIGVAALVGTAIGLVGYLVAETTPDSSLSEAVQGSEALLNVVILLAMAIYFVASLETRLKRRRALRALHRLRSVVHIVDMHQLTKDPAYLLADGVTTTSSPARRLTRFELARYLDYCSELFSLSSKVAALYLQSVNDPVVLEAVNDIEILAAGLSNKVWQKIVVLDDRRPA
jgi:hypothetical protein